MANVEDGRQMTAMFGYHQCEWRCYRYISRQSVIVSARLFGSVILLLVVSYYGYEAT